jgi:hypothetical protein
VSRYSFLENSQSSGLSPLGAIFTSFGMSAENFLI